MKRRATIAALGALIFFSLFTSAMEGPGKDTTLLLKFEKKQNALVLYCHGGGGHVSAANAVEESLNNIGWNVKTVDFLGETIAHLDPIHRITGNATGQDVYNWLLRNEWKRSINAFYGFGNRLVSSNGSEIEKATQALVQDNRPQLVVSVIPLVNASVARALERESIPFLIIPTDLDIRGFVSGVTKESSHNCWLGLGFEQKLYRSYQNAFGFDRCVPIGFPVRMSFTKSHKKEACRKEFSVIHGKPAVFLIMGAAGANSIVSCLKALSKVRLPLHAIVCVGRNRSLVESIEKLSFPADFTYTTLQPDADIAKAMCASELCITKPGSVTFAETIYTKTPTLLDATHVALAWEDFNLDFAESHGIGKRITSYAQAAEFVFQFLNDTNLQKNMRAAFKKIECKKFAVELCALAEAVVSKKIEHRFFAD